MKRALIIALREVRTYLKDKADLAFSLLLPVATFALIYGAFGGTGLFHGTAYIVNEDTNGIYAEKLVEKIGQEQSLDVELLSRQDAENKLDRSDLNIVLLIPSGFSDKLISDQPGELTFLQRGNGGQEGQIVASIIRGVVSGLNQEFTVLDQSNQLLTGKDIAPEKIAFTTQKFLEKEQQSPLIEVKETAIGSKPNMVNQFLPGIITMYVLFAINVGTTAIVEERRKGTLERLLTTHLSLGELFFGKFMASALRGFIQTFILLALSYAVFRIFTPISFLECLLIALLFTMACSTLGLVIASVSRTQDSATWIGVTFTMAMTMFGGTFFTISKGTALYALSKLSINTYANDAFKAIITEGGHISDLGVEIGVIAGVAIVGLVVSRLLFKAVPRGK
ncbi:MAG: ABC transporter permease [Dehalococcoidales bacterium]|nr:ABC transporter permease [Dehalococcoidales bacterium]